MKEDSLLSSLSNVSYHGKYPNFDGSDFFDKSLPAGEVPLPLKNSQQIQEEVDINLLGFNDEAPRDHYAACFWTSGNNLAEGQSENCSEFGGNTPMPEVILDFGVKIKASPAPAEAQEEKKISLQAQLTKDSLDAEVKCEEMQSSKPVSPKKRRKKTEVESEMMGAMPMMGTMSMMGAMPMIKKEESERVNSSNEDFPIGTCVKNETKNIPKNYGKAIITFIEKYREEFEPVFQEAGVSYTEFMNELAAKKKYINTIANLRDLWIDFTHSKCMRVLSNQFLRKHALHYIFNSRICNYTSHIKYRKRLQEAIQSPGSFRHIKQY